MKSLLFQPDIFFNPGLELDNISDETNSSIYSLVDRYYSDEVGTLHEIQEIKRRGDKTNNFKVSSSRGVYLVKKFSYKRDLPHIDTSLSLSEWLDSEGVPVPRLVRSKTGSSRVSLEGEKWAIFIFKEGRHFKGENEEELSSTAYWIGRLNRALKSTPAELLSKVTICPVSDDDIELFKEFRGKMDAWDEIFGEEWSGVIKENWDLILASHETINASREKILRGRSQLTHLDLHPHNIIIDRNQVSAFIDISSCEMTNVCVSLGFAIYKLLKQHAVTCNLKDRPDIISKHAMSFLLNLHDVFPFSDEEIKLLYHCAMAEIFRRLLIVVSLNIYQRDKSWNFIIPTHISGLRECGVIFSLF